MESAVPAIGHRGGLRATCPSNTKEVHRHYFMCVYLLGLGYKFYRPPPAKVYDSIHFRLMLFAPNAFCECGTSSRQQSEAIGGTISILFIYTASRASWTGRINKEIKLYCKHFQFAGSNFYYLIIVSDWKLVFCSEQSTVYCQYILPLNINKINKRKIHLYWYE